MSRSFRRRFQKGISLLEVMLSLSIIAIILVMATRYFFSASGSQKASQLNVEVQGMAPFIDQIVRSGQATNYGTVTVAELASAGAFMNDSAYQNGVWNNPWGNAITINATTGTSNYVISTAVPTSACTALLSYTKNTDGTGGACASATGGNSTYTFTGPITSAS